MRIRLEHYEGSDCGLPKSGKIVSKHGSSSSAQEWFLVQLDDQVEYQQLVKAPYQFRLVTTDFVLIASRVVGQEIGGDEPASVFLLLVEPNQLPLPPVIDAAAYLHVAWATCHRA